MNEGRYPTTRLRRNRQHDWSRRLVAEARLTVDDVIWPVFVHEGAEPEIPVESLPGVSRYSLNQVVDEVAKAKALGINAVALFPVTDVAKKNDEGTESYNKDNIANKAVRAIKANVPDIGVICDVALDPYTTHGHDGIFDGDDVLNDMTVEVLCKQALVLAESGADYVAPSDMMDGRIGAIREALDEAGYQNTGIISYAAKYASAFYGPFRDAVGSAKNLSGKGKHSYQMDVRNAEEALREVALDVEEGADMVMVKPGMPYLDIVRMIDEAFHVPLLAYQVSGEYAMMKAAEQARVLDGDACMMESLMAFKRAGADAILTYAARDVADMIRKTEGD